jgi:hypothetical protein
MIRDFRLIYDVPGNSELIDKRVLETLDSILNKKIAQKKFKTGAAATISAKGRDFAVRYLPATKEWVEKSLRTCRSVEQSLISAMNAKAEPDFPSSVYQPFMQHFRLQICIKAAEDAGKNRLRGSGMLMYGELDQATKSPMTGEMISKVNMIANVFAGIKTYLMADPDTIFLSSAETTNNIAECDLGTKKIKFFEKNFFEATPGVQGGMDRKSASWVTIHESAHAILLNLSIHREAAGPGDNPYSYRDGYYGMTWRQAPRNPDAYAHFAYQIAAGKQNFGPWA